MKPVQMQWERSGLIFEPRHHHLPNRCREFAQSPQALVFEDFVRIYFSSRATDEQGKYLSHVCFVDMDLSFHRILRVSTEPVMALGALGCFDEHGIFPINVLRHRGELFAYTCGWSRRVAVPVETSIGLALSRDNGCTFQRHGTGPVLASSLHEPFLVSDPFVQVLDGIWHMWYIFGVRWIPDAEADGANSRVYKIGHAVSDDGIAWIKEGRQIIPDTLNVDECQALPSVITIGSRHHMFFCYREAVDFRRNPRRSYRIGYAFSDDLLHWSRRDDLCGLDAPPTGWDSEMMCYPHVFDCGGRVCLMYNGNEFGRHGFGVAILKSLPTEVPEEP